VKVNGQEARALRPNFAEWEVKLAGTAPAEIQAIAEDAAGNIERRPHKLAQVGDAWQTSFASRADAVQTKEARLHP
jgi:hypothetical protein